MKTVADLQQQTLLRDQKPVDRWHEWLAPVGVASAEVTGPVIVDPSVRVQSAVDELGVVLANPLINEWIDSGQLCEPFDTRLEGYGTA